MLVVGIIIEQLGLIVLVGGGECTFSHHGSELGWVMGKRWTANHGLTAVVVQTRVGPWAGSAPS